MVILVGLSATDSAHSTPRDDDSFNHKFQDGSERHASLNDHLQSEFSTTSTHSYFPTLITTADTSPDHYRRHYA
ncbi:hypothetical protein BDU57DRAFT_24911 [Ampelomyces quisqualis]|uniref:Uncharacterized protein n=1 Tax=Ampelomyces quisqualis TaxID=50730 RepID=A0A6A5QZV4_AMPQU|nr:hypothetical protein BDU57DRAFT_24911 [Ampelomyces quisqualis]